MANPVLEEEENISTPGAAAAAVVTLNEITI